MMQDLSERLFQAKKEFLQAKLKVMADVIGIDKDKVIQAQSIKYAGIDSIITKLRPSLVAHGFSWHTESEEQVEHTEIKTKSGGLLGCRLFKVVFVLSHIGGWEQRIQMLGEGSDSGDKASNKANTSALKYALLQAFLLQGSEDSDDTVSQPRQDARQQQRQVMSGGSAQPQPGTKFQPNDQQKKLIDDVRKTVSGWVKHQYENGEYVQWRDYKENKKVVEALDWLRKSGYPAELLPVVLRPVCQEYFNTWVYPSLKVETVDHAEDWLTEIEKYKADLGAKWASDLHGKVRAAVDEMRDSLAKIGA